MYAHGSSAHLHNASESGPSDTLLQSKSGVGYIYDKERRRVKRRPGEKKIPWSERRALEG